MKLLTSKSIKEWHSCQIENPIRQSLIVGFVQYDNNLENKHDNLSHFIRDFYQKID